MEKNWGDTPSATLNVYDMIELFLLLQKHMILILVHCGTFVKTISNIINNIKHQYLEMFTQKCM